MSVIALEGYVPEGLEPIDYELQRLVPFNPGERLAFPDLDHEHAGKYGIVKAIGFADGGVRFDLLVFDPSVGVTGEETVIYRARLGEMQ